MSFSLKEIAQQLDLTLEGDADCRISGMSELASADADSLCFAESEKYTNALVESAAGGCIVDKDFPPLPGRNLLRAAQPRLAFLRAMELFAPAHAVQGIHPTAVIADAVQLGDGVGIGAGVVIGQGAIIGDHSMLRAGCYIGEESIIGRDSDIGVNAVVLQRCRIGDRCRLQPGVVIGADGYGYQWLEDHHHKIPQLGIVVVEDDVEIGANSCVDRATLGETRIGRGSKLDNLVHIAHNNRIGRHVLLIAQVGIAGSSELGDGVIAAGQSGVADHVHVAAGVRIGAQAGVIKDVKEGEVVFGMPARPLNKVLREQAAVAKLADLRKLVRKQEKQLQLIQQRLDALEKGS